MKAFSSASTAATMSESAVSGPTGDKGLQFKARNGVAESPEGKGVAEIDAEGGGEETHVALADHEISRFPLDGQGAPHI
jgi:hypothetical protein